MTIPKDRVNEPLTGIDFFVIKASGNTFGHEILRIPTLFFFFFGGTEF
jgi:hypothetical protein